MAKQKKVTDPALAEETAAAATLHPAAKAIPQPDSRTGKLAAIIGSLATVDDTSLTSILDQVLAKAEEIGHGMGVGNVSGSNKNTLNMKPSAASGGPTPGQMAGMVSAAAVKEDLETVFGGVELTEEFKEKTAVIFEAAVNARVAATVAEAEESMIAEVEEFKADFEKQLSEKIDSYLDYVAETWMKENEVAIVSSLRADMTEEFVLGLKTLFAEHYIELPEDKVDAVEALSSELEDASKRLGEAMAEVAALKEEKAKYDQGAALAEVSEGLALTQVEKFKTLVEGIQTDGSIEDFKKKAQIIREKHFPNGKSVATTTKTPETLTEEADGSAGSDSVNPSLTGVMKRYADAITMGNRGR
jgi:hypothetical protein